jgi:hypothetical protein
VRRFAFSLLVFFMSGMSAIGQNAPTLPVRSATVSSTQALSFGDFSVDGTAGGTVTVSWQGVRNRTGEITLLNMGSEVTPAVFEFKLCPGRTINILYSSSTVEMSGSNGGKLYLHVGPTSFGPSEQFTSNKGCDDFHRVYVGGTLDVGSYSANPGGDYAGSFQLTFVQQ